MIGIDFGASYVDVVRMERGKMKQVYSVPQQKYSEKFFQRVIADSGEVAVTGGRAQMQGIAAVHKRNRKLQKLERKLGILEVGEIQAIAEGAKFLTGKKRFVAFNVGTGTPIIFVDGKKTTHIAGTGIGGGTLEGLGRLLSNARVEELEKLAKKGKLLDLKISDIVGGNLGKIPADATASNFGKVHGRKISREDAALGLLNLVAEALGVMASLAARACNCKDVVFTGRVTEENAFIRERIAAALKLFGGRAIFPKNAKYCTAIGAALIGEKMSR